MLLTSLSKENSSLIEIVLHPHFSFGSCFVHGCMAGTLLIKLLGVRCRMLPKLAGQFSISGCLLVAPFKLLLMLPNLCGDTLNPVASIFSDGSAQLTVTSLQGAPLLVETLDGDLVTA